MTEQNDETQHVPVPASPGWRERAYGIKGVAAVAVAGLIIGGGAGAAIHAATADDGGRDGRPGRMGPGGFGAPGGQPPGQGQGQGQGPGQGQPPGQGRPPQPPNGLPAPPNGAPQQPATPPQEGVAPDGSGDTSGTGGGDQT